MPLDPTPRAPSVRTGAGPRALLTVTGEDRPGVTARLFAALAASRPPVEVVDVEQVVVHGHLVLGVVVAALPPGTAAPVGAPSVADGAPSVPDGAPSVVDGAPVSSVGAPPVPGAPAAPGGEDDAALLARLTGVADAVAAETGMRVQVESATERPPGPAPTGRPHHVVVLGRPVPPGAVAEAARAVAAVGGNIDAIRRLSDYPVTSFELTVSGAESTPLRTGLASVAAAAGADIAVEQVGLARRSKRLIVLDVDSTLVRGEVIDELAARAGRAAEVARITAAAMHGELDFAESLRARVAALAGLPVEVLDEVREALELTPGARTLIHTLQRLGFRCGIVSGGFTQITDPLAEVLGLDFAAANTLDVADGRLTGGLVGEIVDRAGKARALVRFAERYGIPLEQTVAVGDGANDLDMLNTAGLGIAFNAKPVVREQAHAALNQPYLDAVLQVLGFSRDEVLDAV
ncbi:phosphoserine phosphatase SerB [Geodermatophilus sp. YIM 151500]|uniref:phosphoserine phosphatase SerB n=1 Tax=Geodermatophilus sp. YIM 151500 TaxID=2984531 RepID=UPI0021E4C729|nr:phosphoserine phosphatase SerB [Geodermatophilus sp. YIM 151500]MCV2491578.1 phosphoserine phosphatase SerB [Geodermatophilus sp. YIM 151500]